MFHHFLFLTLLFSKVSEKFFLLLYFQKAHFIKHSLSKSTEYCFPTSGFVSSIGVSTTGQDQDQVQDQVQDPVQVQVQDQVQVQVPVQQPTRFSLRFRFQELYNWFRFYDTFLRFYDGFRFYDRTCFYDGVPVHLQIQVQDFHINIFFRHFYIILHIKLFLNLIYLKR